MSFADDQLTPEETLVAECIENFRTRRARGEHPDPETYRDQLPGCFEDFLDVLAVETVLDEALTVPKELRLPQEFGPYTLESELGRGSSGVVYEALDRATGEQVAIKVMRAGFDTDPLARERFLREAQACQKVNHTNVVEILAAGEHDTRPYYAMTLIRGSSLSDLGRRGDMPAPPALCRGLAGIAAALHTMHRVGIVHRDVKPSNIVVEPEGRMVLTDFGLARMDIASTLTRTGSSLGTPLYMSPEQMMSRREDVDGRSDVYGLGATLYEALTGSPPFEADDYRSLVPKILSERPAPPWIVEPKAPRDCGRIALKCLEKDPRDRYQDAQALQSDLMAFVDGKPVRGGPVSSPKRVVRAAGRHPVLSLVAVAAALVIVLLLTVFNEPDPAYLDVRMRRPAKAQLFVDGESMSIEGYAGGIAGLEGLELSPGTHTLRCVADGYVDFEDTFEVQAGRTQSYLITMEMTLESLRDISRRMRSEGRDDDGGDPENPDDG